MQGSIKRYFKKIFTPSPEKPKTSKLISSRSKCDIIVLHQYKTIYVPIPKVACSSLKVVCAELLNIEVRGSVHEIKYPGIQGTSMDSTYKDYFKFCFVRNPWDRLVSCYSNKIGKDKRVNNRYFKNGTARILVKYGVFKAGMSFEASVKATVSIPDVDADTHFRSQYLFITDKEGNVNVEFIGKFEKLDDDFEKVCKMMGLSYMQLPHEEKTAHEHYSVYYNEETRQMVAERYKKDIDMFGYGFDESR